MGSKELVDGVRDYRERLMHTCLICGAPHYHREKIPGCIHCEHEY